eukprot:TRINITY_DN705_c0_g1_i1.p1 TRINITY_DN705_c0_g1~~TRINITY_DN705_c0_g1_i1.p1  ORF type:complete len:124 (-),score=53.44 TRINITY_DN705_c0_g1_i1:310-681(-)
MSASQEAVDRYMAAVEAGDGEALRATCSSDAKLYDSEGALFLDMSQFGDGAAVTAEMKDKMGGVTLKYSNRSLQLMGDTAEEVHDVQVKAGEDVVANVQVRVKLEFNAEGKVAGMSEEFIKEL